MKPDINAVLAVSVRRQLDDANNVIASLMQERHELRETISRCIGVFEELALSGKYPEPLLGVGGWTFATTALARASTPVSAEAK